MWVIKWNTYSDIYLNPRAGREIEEEAGGKYL